MFSYVADVMAIDGDIYALCASDVSGELYRLDPENGAIKAHATVGANPTELAGLTTAASSSSTPRTTRSRWSRRTEAP